MCTGYSYIILKKKFAKISCFKFFVIFRMKSQKFEIRAIIKHEFALGHKPKQSWQNICVSKGPGVVSLRTVEEWFAKFKRGQGSIDDRPKSGRPPIIDEAALLAAIEADPTLSTRMLAEDFGCSHVQISRILHKLGKKVRQGKWVPHDLTPGQKNQRLAAARQLLARNRRESFWTGL